MTHPTDDMLVPELLDEHASDAFAAVVQYARYRRFSHVWTNEWFRLIRGDTVTIEMSIAEIRADARQAARSLLAALLEDEIEN